MTPKEKATELVNKFIEFTRVFDDCSGWVDDIISAKQCALIAVEEIIKSSPLYPNDAEEWLLPADWFSYANISAEKYWIEVKKEIEAL